MFTFLPGEVAPNNKLVVIASADAYVLGVLQSRHYVAWMLAPGNWLGAGNMVALNAERVKEEAAGTVRWLRPEFQAPEETRRRAVQTEMAVAETTAPGAVAWPKDVPSQFVVLRTALARGPASAQDVTRRFKGPPRGAKMAEMLATLAALGQARPVGDGRYVA